MMTRTPHNRSGFTLIEMALVIGIIGLLIGGVVTGRGVIRNGELRAVGNEAAKFSTMGRAFSDKYSALAGDMSNATTYWGKNSTYCNGDSGTAVSTGTCNGNGDDIINVASGASSTGEMFQFWHQLWLAGMMDSNLSGISGSGGTSNCVARTNCPASKLRSGMWWTGNAASYAGDASMTALDYGNFLLLGADTSTSVAVSAVLTPEDAYSIDKKFDDGRPSSGFIVARFWDNACFNGGSNSDVDGSYAITTSTVQCALYFVRQF